MKELRRVIPLLLLVTMLSVPVIVRAGTLTSCSFDETGAVVSVTVDGIATIARLGDAIAIDGIACDTATIANTDRIMVDATAASAITIDLSQGSLAPGLTDEGDGRSEIETEIEHGTDIAVAVVGSDGDDTLALARISDGGVLDAIDFDAVGPDLDVDLTLHADDATSVSIDAGGGNDRLDVSGTPYGVPYTGASTLQGGEGRDILVFGGALETTEPTFLGGPGRDTLNISALAGDEQASVDLTYGVAIVGATSAESVAGIETVIGHGGLDILVGASGRQTLKGGGGGDIIEGRAGDDLLRGGTGGDDLRGGSGVDTCLGGPGNDSLTRCEH